MPLPLRAIDCPLTNNKAVAAVNVTILKKVFIILSLTAKQFSYGAVLG